VCPERKTLRSAYEHATQTYSDAVVILNKNIGICAKDRYDVFFRNAQEARDNVATARLSLAKHIDKHGCR
jgi:hypothetical protein